jgi:hypothetical protein
MCVKCIVDSSHNNAAATMLIMETTGWERALDHMFDPKNGIELTDEEHQAIIDLSQKMCDWAAVMQKWIAEGAEVMGKLAKAHSYPNLPKPHKAT